MKILFIGLIVLAFTGCTLEEDSTTSDSSAVVDNMTLDNTSYSSAARGK